MVEIRYSSQCTYGTGDLQRVHGYLPDIVKWLCLMDYDAACGTPVAVEEMLHNATSANWWKEKHNLKHWDKSGA